MEAASVRLLTLWQERVGDIPPRATTDYRAWLKEGFTEAELRELILKAAARRTLREPEHVHERVRDDLRAIRRQRRQKVAA